MARTSSEIRDTSPPGSPHVDVDVRVGWLVRTTRLRRPSDSHRLSDLAREVEVSPGTLSRWEKGQVRLADAHLERLETALAFTPGSLRGVVSLVRRQFRVPEPVASARVPAYGGAGLGLDLDAGASDDLAETSNRVRAAFEGTARGLDWLRLADAVERRRLLVPWPVIEPVLRRLISEHARSVVPGYFAREDALVRLVGGPYGVRLQSLLLDVGLAEDGQARVDTLGTLGQCPTPETLTRLCGLLADERDEVFRGAMWALEYWFRQARGSGGNGVVRLLPRLESALVALPPHRRTAGLDLVESLPPGVRRALEPRLGRRPAPRGLKALPPWRQHAVARDVARMVAVELGTTLDPMVERLVAEALFDAFWSKRLMARFLLMATPYAAIVGDGVMRVVSNVDDVEDDPLNTAALDFVTSVDTPEGKAIATAWARDPRPSTRQRGLVALAHFGRDVDPALLTDAVRLGGQTTQRALYAAGMTGSPVLATWVATFPADSEVGRGAAWWLRHGPRVSD